MRLHFRRVDYEKYDNFEKFDIAEDERIKIRILPALIGIYNYVIDKLQRRNITLYTFSKEEGLVEYAELEPPNRKFLVQRVFSEHLALEHWTKIVNVNEFSNVYNEIKDAPGKVLEFLGSTIKTYRLPRSYIQGIATNVVMNETTRGILSKPEVMGISLFSINFAFNCALAHFVYHTDVFDFPMQWREWIYTNVYTPMYNTITRVLDEVRDCIEKAKTLSFDIETILIKYLEKVGEVSLNPSIPLDLASELEKYGYDLYDLFDAIQSLYNKGIIDGEVFDDGRRIRFYKIWLKV